MSPFDDKADDRKGVWKSGRGRGRATPKGRHLYNAALQEVRTLLSHTLLLAVAWLTATPASADLCASADQTVGTPFEKIRMTLGPTTRRALCGYDISRDIAFWRSMWRYHGCADDSALAASMSRFWAEETLKEGTIVFARMEREEPEYLTKLCADAGSFRFPDEFQRNHLNDGWRNSTSP